jgi:hypothetical protein
MIAPFVKPVYLRQAFMLYAAVEVKEGYQDMLI